MAIKLMVELEEETIRELFEDYEVKFSKKKLKELKENLESVEIDIVEQLQETLKESLGELIQELE